MILTYTAASSVDIEPIYQFCQKLIQQYEDPTHVDFHTVLNWLRRKIETCIHDYTVVWADGKKAGYYHFYKNEDGFWEIDDLYILPEYQSKGIGSTVIRKCCTEAVEPVILYVFIQNQRAVSLYRRLGFAVAETISDSRYIMKYQPVQNYYAAYNDRYKTAHAKGVSWSADVSTPIVMEIIRKYGITPAHCLLEIGCGEGRDSKAVLQQGFSLTATDISAEAIDYCKKKMPQFQSHFHILDCLSEKLDRQFDFIYAIAVIHMLVLDDDRNGFYQFLHQHLSSDGIALICTMGDGEFETQSDISQAFQLQERNHESGKMLVAATSCRMVSFPAFEEELRRNQFDIIEKGITASLPNFNSLMYAVVRKH